MIAQCYVLFPLVIFCSSLVAATPCYRVSLEGQLTTFITNPEFIPKTWLPRCENSRQAIKSIVETSLIIQEIVCCQWDAIYSHSETVQFKADWTNFQKRQNQWVRCPPGFFLEGLSGSRLGKGYLKSIDGGPCVKPSSHPYGYGECNDEPFDLGVEDCEDGYFVTGLFRGSCQEPTNMCIEKVRCCQMSSKQMQMDSLDAVKIRIMEETLVDISYLAHYLGYDNAGGCRSDMVGQDFLRNGDMWEAVKGDKCKDYPSAHIFSIEYQDWKFSVKNIAYSEPIIDTLNPETIDVATIYNKDNVDSSHLIRRTEKSVTTMTHTKTSKWSASHDAGIQSTISVNALFLTVSHQFHYKFNYASEETKGLSESNEQSKIFEVESSKVIPPNSAVKMYLKLFKSRTTVSYTATVLVHFSVRLRGFLRGGEYYSNSTNHNYNYRGLQWRDHNYTFGGSSEPFYTSLKKESTSNSKPWMWNDMQANYNYRPEDVINNLINEDNYLFTLTRKIDAVLGNSIDIEWVDLITGNETNNTTASGQNENDDKCFLCGLLGKDEKRDAGRSRRESIAVNDSGSGGNTRNIETIPLDEKKLEHFAQILPGDPPPVFPPPPQVNIPKTPKKEREPLTILGN